VLNIVGLFLGLWARFYWKADSCERPKLQRERSNIDLYFWYNTQESENRSFYRKADCLKQLKQHLTSSVKVSNVNAWNAIIANPKLYLANGLTYPEIWS